MSLNTCFSSKKIAFGLCLLYLLTLVQSTTLYGDMISGEDFNNINNTLLKIDGKITTQFIANENYSIELEEGTYNITAYYYEKGKLILYSKEKVNVADKELRFDIVLLEPEQLGILSTSEVDIPRDFPNGNSYTDQDMELLLALAVLVILVGIFYYLFRLKNKKKISEDKENLNGKISNSLDQPKNQELEESTNENLDDDIKMIIKIMTDQEGRILQRELREILNFSETKMSLIIAEMEVLGLIKKIKKGRENILKLKKDKIEQIQ